MDYWELVFSLITIYAVIGLSFDVLAGDLRLYSIAQAAVVGVGAYAAAYVDIEWAWSQPLGLVAAVVAGLVASLILAAPALFLSEVHFLLVSLAYAVVATAVFENAVDITNGTSGLVGITSLQLFGLSVYRSAIVAGACTFVVLGLLLVAVRRAPTGRRWRALGEDHVAAANAGVHRTLETLKAFALSGVFAGVAGFLYAHVTSFVDPLPFSLHESIFVLAIMVIGGVGTFWGVAAGAAFGLLLPELLRAVDVVDEASQQGLARNVIFGLLVVLALAFRPSGLLGRNQRSAQPLLSRLRWRSDRSTPRATA